LVIVDKWSFFIIIVRSGFTVLNFVTGYGRGDQIFLFAGLFSKKGALGAPKKDYFLSLKYLNLGRFFLQYYVHKHHHILLQGPQNIFGGPQFGHVWDLVWGEKRLL
jgi:hypothetical protein